MKIWACCIFGWMVPIVSAAQNYPSSLSAASDLQPIVESAQAAVPELESYIRPILTPLQLQIAGETQVRIKNSWEVQARAFKDQSGHRVIEINAGLLVVLDWLSIAGAAIVDKNKGCVVHYGDSLFWGIDKNTRAYALREAGELVLGPFEYASRYPEFCHGIDSGLLDRDSFAQKKRRLSTLESTYWIYAHELGHQVFNHVDRPFHNPPTAAELSRSRADEYEADKFAFRALSQPGSEVFLAMPAYLFIGTRGATAEDESTSSHPSGPRRFRILFDALKEETNNNPEFQKYLKETKQIEKWQQSMQEMRILADE